MSGKKDIPRKILIPIVCVVIVIVAALATYYFVILPSSQPTLEEVVIGMVVPLSGPGASMGDANYWGASKAVEDINKLGGVKVGDKRVRVRLVVYNDESDPSKASSLATRAITIDGVVAIHGGGWIPCLQSMSKVADRYKTPLIGVGPFEPWWAAGPFEYAWMMSSFRIATPPPPGDFRYGKPGYTIADIYFGFTDKFANQTNRKVAVLACDDGDGTGWYMLFGPMLKERGYEPYRVDEKFGLYPPGTTDFSGIILSFKDAKCEILWGNLPGPDFGIFWRQAASLGWKPKIAILGRAPLSYQDVSAWGGDLPFGVGTEVWWDYTYTFPGIGNRTPASLAEEWMKERGYPMERQAGFGGYTGMQVLLAAIEKAGTLDKEAINKAMAELDIMTINGRAKFTDTHDSPVMLTLGQWVKTDKPFIWELQITFSQHPEIKPTHDPIFPIP